MLPPDTAEQQRADLLQTLNNLLDYSERETRLAAVRAVRPGFVKATTITGAEYYFPLRLERSRNPEHGGGFFLVLSVLRRKENAREVAWDGEGLPTKGAKLLDPMQLDGGRGRWRQGFGLKSISNVYQP